MARITWKDSDPSDPMYSEGPRIYSPHWTRGLVKPVKPAGDRKATERDDDGSGKDH
jgi:hypothetical protein